MALKIVTFSFPFFKSTTKYLVIVKAKFLKKNINNLFTFCKFMENLLLNVWNSWVSIVCLGQLKVEIYIHPR